MEMVSIGLVMSWSSPGKKDPGLMCSVHAVVCAGASVTGEQQMGETGFGAKYWFL